MLVSAKRNVEKLNITLISDKKRKEEDLSDKRKYMTGYKTVGMVNGMLEVSKQ